MCFPCILYMQNTHIHEYKTCQEASSIEPNKAWKFLIDSNQQELGRSTLVKGEWLNWGYTISRDTKPCSLCETSLSLSDHYSFSLLLNHCVHISTGALATEYQSTGCQSLIPLLTCEFIQGTCHILCRIHSFDNYLLSLYYVPVSTMSWYWRYSSKGSTCAPIIIEFRV